MKDLILLAISTLTKDEKKSKFALEGEKEEKAREYIGQLEPVVITKLEEKSENDLEIIALCTNETIEENAKNQDNFAEKTAFKYFEERVRVIAKEKGSKRKIAIKSIKIDENEPKQGIAEAVREIRFVMGGNKFQGKYNSGEKAKEPAEFWIDTHGGFRDIAMHMEAVISLLKVDGIVPNQIYGMRYDADRNKPSTLVSQKDSFDMFDFVAGMNEFITKGRADILSNYYNMHGNEGNQNQKAVIDAIKTIAAGTEECNPDEYIRGLDELGKALEGFDESVGILGVFKEYIKDSYGDLLDPEKRTTVDILRKCLEKGLYQQTLTLLETLMPREFVERRIIAYKDNELEQIKNKYEQEYLAEKKKRAHLIKAHDSKYNYIVNKYLGKIFYFKEEYGEDEESSLGEESNQEVEYFNAILRKAEVSRALDESFFCDKHGKKFKKMKLVTLEKKEPDASGKKNFEYDIKIESSIKPEDEKKAGELLRMHKALKVSRNKFNHCNPDRASTEDIKAVLDKYIDTADKLFEKYQKR